MHFQDFFDCKLAGCLPRLFGTQKWVHIDSGVRREHTFGRFSRVWNRIGLSQLQHIRTINAEHRAILNCIFGTATFWSQIMVWSFDQLQRAAHSYFLTKQQEPPPTQKKKYRLPHFNTHEMVAGTSSHSQLQWRWIQCPSQTVAYSNAPWGKCEHSLHIRGFESNVIRF